MTMWLPAGDENKVVGSMWRELLKCQGSGHSAFWVSAVSSEMA